MGKIKTLKQNYYAHIDSLNTKKLHVYEIIEHSNGVNTETLIYSNYGGLSSIIGQTNTTMFGINDWSKMDNYKKISKEEFEVLKMIYG